jgi:hypothetical protein
MLYLSSRHAKSPLRLILHCCSIVAGACLLTMGDDIQKHASSMLEVDDVISKCGVFEE